MFHNIIIYVEDNIKCIYLENALIESNKFDRFQLSCKYAYTFEVQDMQLLKLILVRMYLDQIYMQTKNFSSTIKHEKRIHCKRQGNFLIGMKVTIIFRKQKIEKNDLS